MRVAAHPDLFDAEPESPSLRATRCEECGRVAFPPLAIGCDVCGALESQLTPIEIAAAGVVHASATVHRHFGEPSTPFTIVEVRLDDGPIARGMGAPGPDGFSVGQRVAATWQVERVDDDGNDVVEPVFAAIEEVAS